MHVLQLAVGFGSAAKYFIYKANTCFNYANMLLVLLVSHFATVRAYVMAFSCETIA